MRRSSTFLVLSLAAAAACSNKQTSTSGLAADAAAAEPTPVAIARPAAPTREGASVALGTIGERQVAFVADDDTQTVRAIDLDQRREIGSVGLGSRLGQIVVTKAGQVAVALRDDASVALIDARSDGSLRSAAKISTATEPVALALASDDATLFVATGSSHRLQAFKLEEEGFGRALDLDVAREPRAVAVSTDGARAFVTHASASEVEVVDLPGGKVASMTNLGIAGNPELSTFVRPVGRLERFEPIHFAIDAAIPAMEVDCLDCGRGEEEFLPARFARQAYALARVSVSTDKGLREVFVVPHVEMMTGDPMTVSSGYGGGGLEDMGVDEPTERFSLSVLGEDDAKRKALSHAGDARNKDGCHLPRGAAVKASTMVVACFGSDALMAFSVVQKEIVLPEVKPPPPRRPSFDPLGKPVAPPLAFAPHPEQHLRFLAVESKGRVAVAGGPTGVAIDAEHERVVSFSQLDGTVSIVPFAAFDATGKDAGAGAVAAETIPLLRASGLTEQVARGRRIFFSGGDARISKDGRACSSCHPEGRDDGLVWSTPDGPRQTIMLAGREDRKGPFGWLGKHPTLQIHMQATMKNLKGDGLPPPDQDALAAFLASLKSPGQKWRALTDEETRGRELFGSGDTQCNNCHTDKSGFTDHDVHDVKSATFADTAKAFAVPSLVNIGSSAPYFHDGRYATLEELLDKDNDTMGMTKQLSAADKKALIAYLRTL